MKNIFLIIVSAAILTSCGAKDEAYNFDIETANLEQLRIEKQRIITSYDSIASIIGELDMAISKKDTLKRIPVVTTLPIENLVFKHYVEIQGNIGTDQNVLIYPEYQGMLTKTFVKEGQRVRKGQLLATIDDGGLSSQLAQMETQAALAKTTFERQQRLWNQKIGSEIQFLQSKSAMESAQSAVKQMKAQLQRTRITAPFSGEIDEIITNQGQIVAPGAVAIMRIVNLSDMYVQASVPENYLRTISKGSEVTISIPSLDKEMLGKVKIVGNYINPGNRTFDIQVNVPNKNKEIKPNLVAKLSINDYTNNNAILVPSNIIQENARGQKFVYLISKRGEQNIAVKREIQTGLKHKGQIEVLEGLNAGETIVNEGALTLRDGSEISIKNS